MEKWKSWSKWIALCLAVILLTPSFLVQAAETTAVQRDARLAQITFTGGTISPDFHMDQDEYELLADESGEITLKSYQTVDPRAKMQIQEIKEQNVLTQLQVTVTNGESSRRYIFQVKNAPAQKSDSREDNASLKSLTFTYGQLSPAFSPDITRYKLYLPSDVEHLGLAVVPQDNRAEINSPGEIILQEGQTVRLTVTVTAADGKTAQAYEISIKRTKKTLAQTLAEGDRPVRKSFLKQPLFYIIIICVLILAGVGIWLLMREIKRKNKVAALPDSETNQKEKEE